MTFYPIDKDFFFCFDYGNMYDFLSKMYLFDLLNALALFGEIIK